MITHTAFFASRHGSASRITDNSRRRHSTQICLKSRPGSNDEKVGQEAACKILQLMGGHVGDGIQKIGGLLLGDVGSDHLAIAFRHLEHAINTADKVIIVYCRSVMIIFLH